jgi:hypothetical protein
VDDLSYPINFLETWSLVNCFCLLVDLSAKLHHKLCQLCGKTEGFFDWVYKNVVTSAVKIVHVALFVYDGLFNDAVSCSSLLISKCNLVSNTVGGTQRSGHYMVS